jgi:hypothetical protein
VGFSVSIAHKRMLLDVWTFATLTQRLSVLLGHCALLDQDRIPESILRAKKR